jgi:1-acyl-sn-glycerol-3-phosphate acyltransferase
MLLSIILWLRSLFISIPLILLGTLTAATLAIAAAWIRPKSNIPDRIKIVWARWILLASFVRLDVHGRESIPSSGAVLFCSNHLSYLDPPVLLVALGCPVRFLAKDSLFRIPFFGWAMRREGDIPIERDNPRSAARSIQRAAEAVRAGASFIIFPEGARSRDGEMQPFFSGAFRLAIHAQAPVVPVAVHGSRAALQPGSLLVRGGLVRVTVGEAISMDGHSVADQDLISFQTRQAIRHLLSEIQETA